jgi:integrase
MHALSSVRWSNVDFDKKEMNVVRSVVEMVLGEVKTEALRKAVPLDDFMIEELWAWHRTTPYKEPGD